MTRDEQIGTISAVLLNVAGWLTHAIPIFQIAALFLSCIVSLITILSFLWRKIHDKPKDGRLFNNDQ